MFFSSLEITKGDFRQGTKQMVSCYSCCGVQVRSIKKGKKKKYGKDRQNIRRVKVQ